MNLFGEGAIRVRVHGAKAGSIIRSPVKFGLQGRFTEHVPESFDDVFLAFG